MFKNIQKFLPFSLLFVDIDDFKKVNDNYGHLTGSRILSELGRVFLSNLRSKDIPCRYGGEEFVIILPHTSGEYAVIVSEKIRKVVEEESFNSYEQEPIGLTVSIGVAQASVKYSSYNDLIADSDRAMYKAKEWGKNQTVLFQKGQVPSFVSKTIK